MTELSRHVQQLEPRTRICAAAGLFDRSSRNTGRVPSGSRTLEVENGECGAHSPGSAAKRPKWVVESASFHDRMVLGMTIKLPSGVVESRLEAPGVICPGHDIAYRKAHLES
ncbi:hypothetical protein ANO14919_110750 [Xylariales sp. No.14919]|nr:hypothetical protein ANO14919_110750 [Xylariales sp. No.14919]